MVNRLSASLPPLFRRKGPFLPFGGRSLLFGGALLLTAVLIGAPARAQSSFTAGPEIPGRAGLFPAGDYNGDGYDDLISSADFAPFTQRQIMLGKGDGTFTPGALLPLGTTPLLSGDFNGDGRTDLLTDVSGNPIGSSGGPLPEKELKVLFFERSGAFEEGPLLAFTADLRRGHRLRLGDFNNDRNLDFTYGGHLFLSDGAGGFRQRETNAGNPEVGDLNGDGTLDLAWLVVSDTPPLIGFQGTMEVFTAIGNGDGTFQPARLAHAFTYDAFHETAAYGLFFMDMNEDARPDLVTGLGVLLNQGDGTFRLGEGYEKPSHYMSGHPLDLNGDGRIDFLFGWGYSLNQGGGDFEIFGFPTIGSPEYRGVHGDFNNDGKVDLVLVDNAFRRVPPFSQILFNAFPAPDSSSCGEGTLKGDLNGDRTLNLADAIQTLMIVARIQGQPTDCILRVADVDCSGAVTVSDAILQLRKSVFGEAFPCP